MEALAASPLGPALNTPFVVDIAAGALPPAPALPPLPELPPLPPLPGIDQLLQPVPISRAPSDGRVSADSTPPRCCASRRRSSTPRCRWGSRGCALWTVPGTAPRPWRRSRRASRSESPRTTQRTRQCHRVRHPGRRGNGLARQCATRRGRRIVRSDRRGGRSGRAHSPGSDDAVGRGRRPPATRAVCGRRDSRRTRRPPVRDGCAGRRDPVPAAPAPAAGLLAAGGQSPVAVAGSVLESVGRSLVESSPQYGDALPPQTHAASVVPVSTREFAPTAASFGGAGGSGGVGGAGGGFVPGFVAGSAGTWAGSTGRGPSAAQPSVATTATTTYAEGGTRTSGAGTPAPGYAPTGTGTQPRGAYDDTVHRGTPATWPPPYRATKWSASCRWSRPQ